MLSLAQNPLNDLDDVKDIANLPLLKELDFGGPDFLPCNICEIPGYKEFVLTTASSSFLAMVDGVSVSPEDRGSAQNEYVSSVLELQKSLEEIDAQH